jgi:hypothetical protein
MTNTKQTISSDLSDTAHEDARDWYESLGYTPDGHHTHPIAPYDVVVDIADDSLDAVIEALIDHDERISDIPPAALEALASYAVTAAVAAADIESALSVAVAAALAGDATACDEALAEASEIELEYGDDPAASDLRRRLLATLHADVDDDSARVVCSDGGIWHPHTTALIQVLGASDPEEFVLEACVERPQDGEWSA